MPSEMSSDEASWRRRFPRSTDNRGRNRPLNDELRLPECNLNLRAFAESMKLAPATRARPEGHQGPWQDTQGATPND